MQPLWKTVWSFLKKLEIELPYDLAILLLGINSDKTLNSKDTCTLKFIATLFTISKHGSNLNVHQQMNAYTHNGVLLSYNKNKIMLFATRMDLEIIILSEVRLKEKDKYHVISFICGI